MIKKLISVEYEENYPSLRNTYKTSRIRLGQAFEVMLPGDNGSDQCKDELKRVSDAATEELRGLVRAQINMMREEEIANKPMIRPEVNKGTASGETAEHTLTGKGI